MTSDHQCETLDINSTWEDIESEQEDVESEQKLYPTLDFDSKTL